MNCRLIVNADDLGYSPARNDGIVQCIRAGAVRSCSLLVNAVFTEEAVKLVNDLPVSLGLHLNLTEGLPIYRPHKTLIDSTGFFHGKASIEALIVNGHIDLTEVNNEIVSQIEKFIKLCGRLPSHVDGHQHVHVIAGIRNVICQNLVAYGIKKIRIPYEFDVGNIARIGEEKLAFFKAVIRNSFSAMDDYGKVGLRWPTNFIGLSVMGEHLNHANLQQALHTIRKFWESNGKSSSFVGEPESPRRTRMNLVANREEGFDQPTVELMCHPGVISCGKLGGCGQGEDQFSMSPDRQMELEFLTGNDFRKFLDENRLSLGSFHDV